jgi:RNA polymerase sigma factor (sigma-70 family)
MALMNEPHRRDTRSSVIGRVRNPDDRAGWQTFFELYGSLIHGQAIKAGLTNDEAQEVAQETLIEISQRIPSFEYDRRKGSFKAWLFKLTRWRITNQFHKRRSGIVPIDCLTLDAEDSKACDQNPVLVSEPESWEREWRQTVFEAALKKLRHELPPRQFQVFDCLTAKEWSVSRVASTLRMNRAQIYLVKFRVVSALKKEIKRLEKEPV